VQRFGDFSFDPGARELRRGQERLHLSPKCFELLALLLAERPRAVPKVRLHEGLWPKTFVSESSLTKLVTELRAVLGDAQTPRFVRTAHRFGYAFCTDVVEDTEPVPRSEASPSSLFQAEREIRLPEGETVAGRSSEAGTRISAGQPLIEDLPSRRRLVVVGVVVAGLAVVVGGMWLARRRGHGATPAYSSAASPKRMAVLPFENLGAAEDGYFADG
jgi:DNA-binding winged helix-turn-helix (wHTH) protein